MGLDMYLSKKTYVKNWDFQDKSQQHKVTVKKGGKVRTDIKPERVSYITESVGYWRKANAIHQWFVDTCQDGNDDCREAYVSREQLEELRKVCLMVIDNNALAGEHLPTQSGFFFGSTEYDEWYYADLKDTVAIIDRCLNEVPDTYEFYYGSSW